MPHQRKLILGIVSWLGAFLAAPALAVDVPTVSLTNTVLQPSLQVGDSTSVTVSAAITSASSTDGLIAFDLDLFPLNKTGIHFTSLAALDPAAIVVSTGTPDPVTGGILGITGLYNPTGVGLGSPVHLFTVQVHADAPGPNSISAGLSVYPNGTGIPLQLNLSGDYIDPSSNNPQPFLVDSSGAIAQVTVSVPEPSTVLLCGTLMTLALLKRRCRGLEMFVGQTRQIRQP